MQVTITINNIPDDIQNSVWETMSKVSLKNHGVRVDSTDKIVLDFRKTPIDIHMKKGMSELLGNAVALYCVQNVMNKLQ